MLGLGSAKAFGLIVTLIANNGVVVSNVGLFETKTLCENAAIQYEVNYKARLNMGVLLTQCSQMTGDAEAFAEENDGGDEGSVTTNIPPDVVSPEIVAQADKSDFYTILMANLPKPHELARILKMNPLFLQYSKDFLRVGNMTDDDFIQEVQDGKFLPGP